MPSFRSESIARQVKMYETITAMSDRLETGLSPAAVESVVDLLRAGVAPDAIVAMVSQLQQQTQQK